MSSTALVPSQATLTKRDGSSPLSSSNTSLPTLNLTPKKDSGTNSRPSTPKQLGQHGWIHPRMDEVIRRRNRTNFDSSNMKTILASSGLILASLFVPSLLHSVVPSPWLHAIHPYPNYILWLLRALFTLSIAVAASPLLRMPDACEDVPLSPAQRQLLGLPPMSRPATPQEKEQYVTPPRFSRSNTPRSSPLSGRGTPVDGSGSVRREGSGSPFASQQQQWNSSGGVASPLRSGGERRRLSYTNDRRHSFNTSEFDAAGSMAATPSKGNKASVGLNNKWLYEKGRASPNSGGLKASRGPSFI